MKSLRPSDVPVTQKAAVLGLTAIITFQFMRALLPTSTYSHKIIFQKPVK